MAVISLYLDGQDEKLIKNYAKSKNISVSAFLRSIAVEKIEDDLDDRLYEEAVNNSKNGNHDISLAELRKEMEAYCWLYAVMIRNETPASKQAYGCF